MSPTDSAGYGVQGGLAAFVACGLVAVAATREPLALLALFIPGVFLRDAWAWFASTEAERAAFLDEVERLKARGWGPPPNEVQLGGRWTWAAVAALVACLGLSIVLASRVHPAFLVLALFSVALLAAVLLDRLRARMRKSAA